MFIDQFLQTHVGLHVGVFRFCPNGDLARFIRKGSETRKVHSMSSCLT